MISEWEQLYIGFKYSNSADSVDEPPISHTVFADNLYFYANDTAMLQYMLDGVTEVLHSCGDRRTWLRWKPGSMQKMCGWDMPADQRRGTSVLMEAGGAACPALSPSVYLPPSLFWPLVPGAHCLGLCSCTLATEAS